MEYQVKSWARLKKTWACPCCGVGRGRLLEKRKKNWIAGEQEKRRMCLFDDEKRGQKGRETEHPRKAAPSEERLRKAKNGSVMDYKSGMVMGKCLDLPLRGRVRDYNKQPASACRGVRKCTKIHRSHQDGFEMDSP